MKTFNRINQFIKATGREKINEIIDEEIVKFGKYISKLEGFSEWITGYVYIDDLPNSLILNIGLENEITNITALITDDDLVAEKMRWSRASYGREGFANILLKSNARVSEFHALEIKFFLQNNDSNNE